MILFYCLVQIAQIGDSDGLFRVARTSRLFVVLWLRKASNLRRSAMSHLQAMREAGGLPVSRCFRYLTQRERLRASAPGGYCRGRCRGTVPIF